MRKQNIQLKTFRIFLMICGLLAACTPRTAHNDKQRLYVSILPLRTLVQQIVDNDFPIDVLVPAGASPESFEPTPKQYVSLNEAELIFNVGLIDFEQNLLRDFPNKEKLVNLSQGIRLLEGSCAHGHNNHDHSGDIEHAHGIDPHIWTSPRALKRMAANAYEAIHAHWPDSIRYTENYRQLIARLDSLDTACAEALHQSGIRTIVIYHPTLTYYAADYGLEQLAIERDGKEPSARHLAQLIETARERGVHRIFYQAQYPVSTVKVIAEDIDAECVQIDPLREDVIENIGYITRQITAGNE